MATNDLTEKLKELLMGCDCGTHPGMSFLISCFTAHDECYSLSNFLAHKIAKQLAPEIEKLMPRWIPVSERLPDELEIIDLFAGGRICDCARSNGKWYLFNLIWTDDYGDGAWDEITEEVTHWMPIMKGPMK